MLYLWSLLLVLSPDVVCHPTSEPCEKIRSHSQMLLPPYPYVPWPSHTSFIAYIFLNPVPPLDASSIAHTASCFEPLESLWLFSMPLFCPQRSITSQNVCLNHKPGSSTLHLKTLPWPYVFYKAYSELTTMAYKAPWSRSREAPSSFTSSTLCSSGSNYIEHAVSVLCALTRAVPSAWSAAMSPFIWLPLPLL